MYACAEILHVHDIVTVCKMKYTHYKYVCQRIKAT